MLDSGQLCPSLDFGTSGQFRIWDTRIQFEILDTSQPIWDFLTPEVDFRFLDPLANFGYWWWILDLRH